MKRMTKTQSNDPSYKGSGLDGFLKRALSVLFMVQVLGTFAQIPTSGLIGSWTFNGNANDVVGNNHGTVLGATLTNDRFGNANSAYNFNGSTNYIKMQNPGPSGSVSRSVAFWAKSSYSGLMAAFDYGTIMVGGCFHILFNYNCQGVGFDVAGGIFVRGNNGLADNNWHHYAAVFDSNISLQMNNVVLYVDGVAQPSITCWVTSTTTALFTGTVDPITIGRTAGAATRYFNGALDDFYFYNRPLTQAEVLALFNYAPCALPAISGNITGNNTGCAGNVITYSINPVSGATSYSWTLPNSWTGTSTTNSINAVVGSSSGNISVVATNTCGTSAPVAKFVASNGTAPALAVSSGTSVLCAGSAVALACNGASTYTWQPGSMTGFLVNATPSVTTIYTVTGTNSGGCSASITFTQNVQVCNGMSETPKQILPLVFPNPFSQLLHIEVNEESALLIYNMLGTEVYRKHLTEGSNVEEITLQPGVYMAFIHSKTNSRLLRLIKE